MALTIVADDLTGACDTGTLFAGPGPVPVTMWPRPAADAPARVVDTESRRLDGAEAAMRAGAVVKGAGPAPRPATTWFKKIDSTLRGPIGAEVDGLLGALGTSSALACPAFPAQGRTVVDRTLYVDGVPLTRTPLARDHALGGKTDNVVDALRRELDRPLAWVPLDQVRAGAEALAARLHRLEGTVVVADAETDADLDALVTAALAQARPPLLVGSAGLAGALATRLGARARPVPLPRGDRWLVVAGSRHPATREQAHAARTAGLAVIAAPEVDQADAERVAAALADEAARRLEAAPVDLVAVAGGETAAALYRRLGAQRIDLVGPPGPGLAFGWLKRPPRPPLALLTKAGGFGAPDLFVTLHAEAAR